MATGVGRFYRHFGDMSHHRPDEVGVPVITRQRTVGDTGWLNRLPAAVRTVLQKGWRCADQTQRRPCA
jgi:hypothetical protein